MDVYLLHLNDRILCLRIVTSPYLALTDKNPTVVPISSATMAAAVGEHGLAPHSHIGGSYHRHPLIASSSFTLCATYRNRSPSQQSTRQCAKEFLEPHSYSGNEATSTPCCKQTRPCMSHALISLLSGQASLSHHRTSNLVADDKPATLVSSHLLPVIPMASSTPACQAAPCSRPTIPWSTLPVPSTNL